MDTTVKILEIGKNTPTEKGSFTNIKVLNEDGKERNVGVFAFKSETFGLISGGEYIMDISSKQNTGKDGKVYTNYSAFLKNITPMLSVGKVDVPQTVEKPLATPSKPSEGISSVVVNTNQTAKKSLTVDHRRMIVRQHTQKVAIEIVKLFLSKQNEVSLETSEITNLVKMEAQELEKHCYREEDLDSRPKIQGETKTLQELSKGDTFYETVDKAKAVFGGESIPF